MKLGLVVTLFNLVDIPQSGFIKTKMNFFIGMQMKVFAKYILTVEHFYHYCPRKIFSQWKAAIKLHIIVVFAFFQLFMIHQQCKNLMIQNIKIA